MAEVLGIVADLVGIADVSFKLILVLNKAAKALGSAAEEL